MKRDIRSAIGFWLAGACLFAVAIITAFHAVPPGALLWLVFPGIQMIVVGLEKAERKDGRRKDGTFDPMFLDKLFKELDIQDAILKFKKEGEGYEYINISKNEFQLFKQGNQPTNYVRK